MDAETTDYVEWAHACAHLTRVTDEKELNELYEFFYLVNTHWTHHRPGRFYTPVAYYFQHTMMKELPPFSFKLHSMSEMTDNPVWRGYPNQFVEVRTIDKTLLEHLLLAVYDLAEYSKQKFRGIKHDR